MNRTRINRHVDSVRAREGLELVVPFGAQEEIVVAIEEPEGNESVQLAGLEEQDASMLGGTNPVRAQPALHLGPLGGALRSVEDGDHGQLVVGQQVQAHVDDVGDRGPQAPVM